MAGYYDKRDFEKAWKAASPNARFELLREHAETTSPTVMLWLEELAASDHLVRDTLWGYHRKLRKTVRLRVHDREITYLHPPEGRGGFPALYIGETPASVPTHPMGEAVDVRFGDMVRLRFDWTKRPAWVCLREPLVRCQVSLTHRIEFHPGVHVLCGGDPLKDQSLTFRPLLKGERPAPSAMALGADLKGRKYIALAKPVIVYGKGKYPVPYGSRLDTLVWQAEPPSKN